MLRVSSLGLTCYRHTLRSSLHHSHHRAPETVVACSYSARSMRSGGLPVRAQDIVNVEDADVQLRSGIDDASHISQDGAGLGVPPHDAAAKGHGDLSQLRTGGGSAIVEELVSSRKLADTEMLQAAEYHAPVKVSNLDLYDRFENTLRNLPSPRHPHRRPHASPTNTAPKILARKDVPPHQDVLLHKDTPLSKCTPEYQSPNHKLSPEETVSSEDVLPHTAGTSVATAHISPLKPVTWKGGNSHPRKDLLAILATTDSASDAWGAYQTLMELPRKDKRLLIPWEHLHRFARLLSREKPRTRDLFIRLLSVISTIHRTGGHVQLWQWNALIDFAGKGWRKTRVEDFKTAFDVYNDMISRKAPGATFTRGTFSSPTIEEENDTEFIIPDIVTFTSLLNIAGRTLDPKTLKHASTLLTNSGLRPNRITLLSLLRYYTRRGELFGVRRMLGQIQDNRFDLGLDGVNACMWAYARHDRLDVASAIYKVLTHRARGDGEDIDVQAASQFLEATEGLVIPPGIIPDQATYTALLQAYAYHGHLKDCLRVFVDMITAFTAPDPESSGSELGSRPTYCVYMVPAYRAIFLGFVRHGQSWREIEESKLVSHRLKTLHLNKSAEASSWNLTTLQAIFNDFLGLPADAEPSERFIYWVLIAFAKTSGDDTEKLREVYAQLEERFGGGWGGRLERFKKQLYT